MIDIIIPIYNEGIQILNLLKKIKKEVKLNKTIYLCYDDDDDNVFDYIKDLKRLNNFNIKIKFLKNPFKGPCLAVVNGLKKSISNCKIVYPADDFLNISLIEKMFKIYERENADIVVASRFIKGGSMKGVQF